MSVRGEYMRMNLSSILLCVLCTDYWEFLSTLHIRGGKGRILLSFPFSFLVISSLLCPEHRFFSWDCYSSSLLPLFSFHSQYVKRGKMSLFVANFCPPCARHVHTRELIKIKNILCPPYAKYAILRGESVAYFFWLRISVRHVSFFSRVLQWISHTFARARARAHRHTHTHVLCSGTDIWKSLIPHSHVRGCRMTCPRSSRPRLLIHRHTRTHTHTHLCMRRWLVDILGVDLVTFVSISVF
jgi:hypothetical protein